MDRVKGIYFGIFFVLCRCFATFKMPIYNGKTALLFSVNYLTYSSVLRKITLLLCLVFVIFIAVQRMLNR